MHGISLWRRVAVWPIAAAMRLWAMTIDVVIADADAAVVTMAGTPTIFILWHNRLFMAADVVRRYRKGHRLYALVSASKDGAWLSAYYSVAGLGAVRGSSSRLGREAAGALIGVLRAGNDVGITPDGPRGPVYRIKPGAAVVARGAGARVVISGMDFESSWRLPSWDGFHLPRPFSRVHMRFIVASPEELEDSEEGARLLLANLTRVNPDRKAAPPVKRRERA